MGMQMKYIKTALLILCSLPCLAICQNNTSDPYSNSPNDGSSGHSNKKSYPNPNIQNNPNNTNNQLIQPNVILSIPTPPLNSNTTQSARRLPQTKPDSPGYDTTSSVGGPSNDQGSITYGSSGVIKTVKPNADNR